MPTIVTRFCVGQPAFYRGQEHVINSVDLRGHSDGRIVERYTVYHLDDDGNRVYGNVDVRHLSPVEAPEPAFDAVLTLDDGRFRIRGHLLCHVDDDVDRCLSRMSWLWGDDDDDMFD